MTTTTGPDAARVAQQGAGRPRIGLTAPSPQPDSLAAALMAGEHPLALLLPGIDARWPSVLSGLLVGRPELAEWVRAVVADVDAWVGTPQLRSLGQFADGFAPLVAAGAPADPRAGAGPALLVGSILVNTVSVMALEADGLAGWVDRPGAVVAGHSAGQLAARLVAGRRDPSGMVRVDDAARGAKLALFAAALTARHPWAVSQAAVAAAMAGDEDAVVPVVAVSGPRTARLTALLADLADRLPDEVAIGVTNSPTRHVLVSNGTTLAELRRLLTERAAAEAGMRAAGRHGGTPLSFTWQPLPFAVPTHHRALGDLADTVLDHLASLDLDLPAADRVPVLDPATGAVAPTSGDEARSSVVHSLMSRPHDWAGTLAGLPAGSVAVVPSALGWLSGISASALQGRGVLLVDASTPAGRSSLFAAGRAPELPQPWTRFAPAVVRGADGALRLANRHTARSGRSPMILPGMTPTTAEAPIVAAAANSGHVAELAGGGQVSEAIFTERVAELTGLLDPGQEVVLNALYLDPYLWGLQVGRERLLFKARAAGAPFAGVTVSAGVPEKAEALALLDALNGAGLWLNAFKPGTTAQVADVLAIAAATGHQVWIHLEGGAAGGHHSWEDLDELLLATYARIREHDNVVLAVGGGVADPQRAADLLTGTWALAHGAPAMPVDAVLLGTVTMAAAEAATSASVKAALAAASGHDGWVARGQVAGGTTSGRSGLDADIHFLDNAAARAARVLDEVAGDAAAVAARRDEIVAALARTAKPYFGDVEQMTYAELLERFVELTALGRDGRYEDGAWLDRTHRARFVALLQRAEARLHPQDCGLVPTLYEDPASVDDPGAALAELLAAHPDARTAVLHPADAAHFLATCRGPGKPVPFVPVLDAEVRRWYQSDSLWQSHSDRYDADQVLIIPGPVAVAGITTVDEPVADLLGRFEADAVARILDGTDAEVPSAPAFRLAVGPSGSASTAAAALAAPTWLWHGAPRSNPLHGIAPAGDWEVTDCAATWTGADGEAATLTATGDRLQLTITWPDLGLIGDGSVRLEVVVRPRAGTVVFAVEPEALERAGRGLLTMFAAGTDVPADPAAITASHSATVGATAALPDAVMTLLWPQVFGALAAADLCGAVFDLVHLRHEVRPGSAEPQGAAVAAVPQVARAEGGLVVEVASQAAGTEVVDRFFVRRTQVDPALPPAGPPAAADGVVDTPVRTLGRLVVTAPQRLEAFASITADPNPIHRSDALARFVGLPGRIVHGMWTSAAATRAVVELAADGVGARLRSWAVDFVAPVLPGQEVTFTVTRTGMRDGLRMVEVRASTEDGVVAMGTAAVAGPRTMYVFPGQGIQSPGMGMDGYARSAAARQVWDAGDTVTRERLGFSILEVVTGNPRVITAVGGTFRHPQGVLHLTQFTQVAMAALASAQVAELREAGVLDPHAALAGHSVGEYNALAACSGGLPLDALIELVFARGMAMHGLVPRDAQGGSDYRLAVVRPHLAGLTHEQTEALVAEVAARTGQLCEVVNHNLRGKQYAVAASLPALELLTERLGRGTPGRPPLLLVPGIDVPFHSSALRPGVEAFRDHLLAKLPAHIDAEALIGRYIPNLYPVAFRLDRSYVAGVHGACGSPVLAELLADWDREAADRDTLARVLLVELLAWQFASPVRWVETFELACAPVSQGGLGIERIIEVGVGAAPTLTNLAKGALALPSHRGTRPWVGNVELDADAVQERTEDPAAPAVAEVGDEAAETAASVPAAAPAPAAVTVADLPVDHGAALSALLALRVSVRPDQLGDDPIEDLVDGASSRRNQVLMDIGKEFGVTAMDGAQDVALPELTRRLAERSSGYRFPGQVLSVAVDSGLTAALGPRGSSAAALAKRVTGHWGLGQGWVARVALTLALGTRDGSSRRGGELGTLAADRAEDLIDAAVAAAAAGAGLTLAPAGAATAAGGTVDAAAVAGLREHFEDLLGDQAEALLARLGRTASAEAPADQREALSALALLEAEHGSAAQVAPRFDARRHVLLASAATWARADVEHLFHGAVRAEAGLGDPQGRTAEELIDQIAGHRAADARVEAALHHFRERAADRPRTLAVIERALAARPSGLAVPELAALGSVLTEGESAEALAAAQRISEQPGSFAGEVALVTGASPGSIAWASVAHLLRGGATVVVVTTTDTPDRIDAYRDLERSVAGPGAALHVVRANLASFTDIDRLLDWVTTPTMEQLGPITREVKPALWPTLVLPFAASPSGGELPDADPTAQLTLRLLLLGVQRLVGGLADRVADAAGAPFTVVLPLSVNHGTFGGDGAYGDAKAALETMANKWRSESGRWGRWTRLVGAEIGWVRGTGLMAAHDAVAEGVERGSGATTFSSAQMGALIAGLCTGAFAERAASAPLRVDLSGGLSGRADVDAVLAAAAAGAVAPAATAEPRGIPALPNLPRVLRQARAPLPAPALAVRPRIRPQDMVVLVGIAEQGPWGGSRTRWEAELGPVSAAGVVELAWRTGLITWDGPRATWLDAASGDPVEESAVAATYGRRVVERCGLRPLADTDAPELREVYLERPVTLTRPTRAEAEALAGDASGATVLEGADGWQVTLPAGATVRLPGRRPLERSVGGQFPSGSDPTLLGLEPAAAATMDPLAAWNIVVTAEALAGAGVTPEELLGAVHPSLVGNTQGSGMGGMQSIESLYLGPMLGRPAANDVLQEALGNVVCAHVNTGLVGGYGPMVHPVAACATAAVSLEEAIDKIHLGKAEIVIGGGWDDLGAQGITGFANMAATADNEALIESGLAPHQHSRPGDRRRRGFVESQGGGSFLVCRGSVALRLGLPVRAVVGYAASFGDGIHTSIPAPGLGALGAARGGGDSPLARALADLGLAADDVEVVSKHDTSTEANDPNEAFLHGRIQQALGRSAGAPLRVISQKSLTGHAKGGAAAWQLAGLCDVFADDVVPGNRNLVSVDPRVAQDCLVVDYRPLRRGEPVRAGLLTSLGFGHVSALVAVAHPDVFVGSLSQAQRAQYQARARDRRVAGALAQLGAQYGGEPVLRRRTDRRLGGGSAEQVRDREAEVLLDPAARLPGAVAP